ncbi:MAG: preprotein translocase subunit SecE [Eubacteriales bacterium]
MAEAKEKLGMFQRMKKFFRDFKSEMKKVTWSSKEQVLHNTWVVLVVILAMGVVVWALDWLFGTGMQWILSKGL